MTHLSVAGRVDAKHRWLVLARSFHLLTSYAERLALLREPECRGFLLRR